ncbi:MAG: LemA family protein [Anaerovoracaceae bacterium]
MKLLENKALSILIMIVLIAGGFWLGGYRSLSGLYNDVEKVFFTGEDGDGICIENDLSERAACAVNLVSVARKYVGESTEVKELSDASAAMSAASGGNDISERLSADKRLEAAMTALYRSLEDIGLSEKDEAYRQRLYADFSSRGDTISHDPYNGYAQDYNETLSRFPASLIAAVTPAKEAVIFY